MFTGLIETIGEIAEVKPTPAGFRVRLKTDLSSALTPGDSLAVNGICLTVVSADPDGVNMDVSPETIRVSALGSLKRGDRVNLERPMRADARVGGHFVQGHVDATGTIEEIRSDEDYWWLTVKFPPSLAAQIVRKGSIAVDGISLTVAALAESSLEIMIIPFTWQHTNASSLRAGDRVNLECDMIGKYVARIAELAVGNRES
jgi:riboflavin synthase